MKIKISKSQWEEMGKKAGWMKSSQANLDNLYQQYQVNYLRLKAEACKVTYNENN